MNAKATLEYFGSVLMPGTTTLVYRYHYCTLYSHQSHALLGKSF